MSIAMEFRRLHRVWRKHFEAFAMYPAKMAVLVFGHVTFLALFVWVFR